MASIELGSLTEHLEEDEIKSILAGLREAEVDTEGLTADADTVVLDRDLDDDLFADFVDQLDANDASFDIYIPIEFDDFVDAAGYRVGSAHTLALVLDEIRDDLFDDEEDEDEDGGDDLDDFDGGGVVDDDPFGEAAADAIGLKEERLRHFWKMLRKGAMACINRGVILFVKT